MRIFLFILLFPLSLSAENLTFDNVRVIDGDTLAIPNGTYPVSGANRTGGVLLPDGRVFCVPLDSTTAKIYNPVTDTLTTPSGTYPGNSAFCGGVLLPDGRVFCVPFNSTTARIHQVGIYANNFPMSILTSPYLNKF